MEVTTRVREREAAELLSPGLRTFVNPYSYGLLSRLRPGYLDGTLMRVDFDGLSLAVVARVMGSKDAARRSFDDTSLAPLIFGECVRRGSSIALVGSGPGVTVKAADLLRAKYPGIRIDFVADGYCTDFGPVLDAASRCDVVVCSMGTPRQEDFLVQLMMRGWCGSGFTCGGYLDQLVGAGGGNYYPWIFDKLNLRWAYRIIKEPVRLVPRYAFDYPFGIFRYVKDSLGASRR